MQSYSNGRKYGIFFVTRKEINRNGIRKEKRESLNEGIKKVRDPFYVT